MSMTVTSSPRPMLNAPPASDSAASEVRADDVVHVDVVARLEAVAEHDRLAAVDHTAAEDRDHAGLAERVLARAVDVAEAERHRGQAVQAVEQRAVALGAELGQAVRGLRRDRVVLGGRDRLRLAVDRPAGGGEHDAAARRGPSRRSARSRCRPRSRRSRRPGRPPTCARPPARPGGRSPRAAPLDQGGHRLRRRGGPPRPARRRPPARPRGSPAGRWRCCRARSPGRPRASRASTRFEPMKPAPPVTRARMKPRMVGGIAGGVAVRGRRAPAPLLGSPRDARPVRHLRGNRPLGEDHPGEAARARRSATEALGVREPGGTELGERVRDLVKDPAWSRGRAPRRCSSPPPAPSWWTAVIRPALERGRVVVSDRFLDSSLAYQGERPRPGGGRGGAGEPLRHRGLVAGPDLPARARPGRGRRARRDADRFEDEGVALQRAVAEAYERLADRRPRALAAHGRRPLGAAIHADVLAAVEAARSGARA